MASALTGAQRKYLKKIAHDLSPVAFVGKNGLTHEVVAAVDEAIATNELIKVKFQDYKDQKRELAAALADETNSALVFIIGNVAILYREHADPRERKISLP